MNPIRAQLKGAKPKAGAGKNGGHYCEKISPGCANCYASAMQPMRFGLPEFQYQHRSKLRVFLDETALQQVLRRKIPTSFFWEDMSDLFGEWVKQSWLDRCFAAMVRTQHHRHLVLTKRIDRAVEYLTDPDTPERIAKILAAEKPRADHVAFKWPAPNIRIGASMENQKFANERMPKLLELQAAGWITFVSAEPLLGAITLKWAACTCADRRVAFGVEGHETTCFIARHVKPNGIIIGGESGKDARPLYLQWVRSLIRQCHEAGIYAFVKQLGAFPTTTPIGTAGYDKHPVPVEKIKLHSRKGGDIAEWKDEYKVREPIFDARPS